MPYLTFSHIQPHSATFSHRRGASRAPFNGTAGQPIIFSNRSCSCLVRKSPVYLSSPPVASWHCSARSSSCNPLFLLYLYSPPVLSLDRHTPGYELMTRRWGATFSQRSDCVWLGGAIIGITLEIIRYGLSRSQSLGPPTSRSARGIPYRLGERGGEGSPAMTMSQNMRMGANAAPTASVPYR
jgi:hypothetical protein